MIQCYIMSYFMRAHEYRASFMLILPATRASHCCCFDITRYEAAAWWRMRDWGKFPYDILPARSAGELKNEDLTTNTQ